MSENFWEDFFGLTLYRSIDRLNGKTHKEIWRLYNNTHDDIVLLAKCKCDEENATML